MKKILISGATGLVGSALTEQLCREGGVEVFAATSNPNASEKFSRGIRIIQNQMLDQVMEKERFDTFVHLAFPRNVGSEKWADGITCASDMMVLAAKHHVDRVIHISSQSLYGWQRNRASVEGDPVVLTSPYTTGKFCMEKMAEYLFGDRPCSNIRLSTIIGPTTEERVPNKMIDRVVQGLNIEIKGGDQEFSFLDVEDAALGLVQMIKGNAAKWKPYYNLGTTEVTNIVEIANKSILIGSEHGYNQSKVRIEEGDIKMSNRMDVSAFQSDFNWVAKYSLRESMERIFSENYLKKHN